MPLQINGATSGSTTLQATDAVTATLTLPSTTDTLAGIAATQTLTNKTLTSPNISGAVMSSMASSVITSGTSVATTSGTSVTFSSIPSWVKRITVMFNGVNLNTSQILVQIGSGSTTTSGYASSGLVGNTGGTGNITASNGFIYSLGGGSGHYVLTLVSSNTWAGSGIIGASGTISWATGISPALSGALDRVIITSASGGGTFNAGSVNILYE